MNSFRLRMLAQTLPFLLIGPVAMAQMPAKGPTRGEARAALNQPANPGAAQYTRQQIDQLVAPIALYPDQLLSQVLMAASYPQQVTEAAQWLQDPSHRDLKGDALVQALEPLPWDPSVKALVAFPQIIAMMNDHIEWTEALGVAFATQQAEVMARAQALRHLAMKSGKLKQVRHLTVREEGTAIVINSAEPDRVYVPVYNPTVVYGGWPDREFPPVYLPPPQGFVAETIEPGFEVSAGYTVVTPLWGWSRPDWREDRITVDRTEYTRITRDVEVGPGNSWRHNGPVVLVAPTAVSRTTVTTTNVPAGTVAPARAGAVVSLPQRAAAQPNLIQSQSTTIQTTTRPGQRTTTTAQPGATPSGQTTPTTTAQPSTTGPSTTRPSATSAGQTPATTAQPSTTPSAQTPTASSQPTTIQPGKAPTTSTAQPATTGKAPTTTAAQPSIAEPSKSSGAANQPGHAASRPSGREQAGSSRPAVGEAEKKQPAANEQTAMPSTKPGKSEASKTQTSAERKAGERHERPGGEAAKNQATTSQSENAASEHAPNSTMAKPTEPVSPRASTKPPAAVAEPRERTPEHAGANPPLSGSTQPARMPEQTGAKPAPRPTAGPAAPSGPGQGHEAPRMKALESGGQGTSAPPQTPPHQAPGPQRPHEAGPKPPGQSPEQGEKKEH